jgi:hypothetical protein
VAGRRQRLVAVEVADDGGVVGGRVGEGGARQRAAAGERHLARAQVGHDAP